MNNGAWNHQRPSCEAVECEENLPNVTLSSNMKLGSVYQDIAVYTCEDGYIPDNEPTSFCQHTGTWSTPNFTCTALGPCYSNPCMNGGTCYEVNGSPFTCTCTPSYTGSTCDEESNSAGGFPSSIATVVGSVAGAILVIVIVIVLIIIFCKRRSNESATTKSKWKESDSSSQYENPVFSQSKTDAHTYQGLNTITHTYQDCNTDVQSYDDTADPRTYEEPDQEANYEEVNGSKEKNYVNDAMIKQNKVLLC
ncbi:delta-like protein A isoform X1 [Strongylocentrotus purpuratus]|uniref:Uncharacterized protein n=1 Tax=Strongylocentrotus purpuratus TaxID=7668 RepID=A0A7M7SV26_STRPU|nr:delta-like protein A isoform X1 [Strongylocentrotus purpuratus]